QQLTQPQHYAAFPLLDDVNGIANPDQHEKYHHRNAHQPDIHHAPPAPRDPIITIRNFPPGLPARPAQHATPTPRCATPPLRTPPWRVHVACTPTSGTAVRTGSTPAISTGRRRTAYTGSTEQVARARPGSTAPECVDPAYAPSVPRISSANNISGSTIRDGTF